MGTQEASVRSVERRAIAVPGRKTLTQLFARLAPAFEPPIFDPQGRERSTFTCVAHLIGEADGGWSDSAEFNPKLLKAQFGTTGV
jgi:hypothetical protein